MWCCYPTTKYVTPYYITTYTDGARLGDVSSYVVTTYNYFGNLLELVVIPLDK